VGVFLATAGTLPSKTHVQKLHYIWPNFETLYSGASNFETWVGFSNSSTPPVCIARDIIIII
jgi:hypothetical protein